MKDIYECNVVTLFEHELLLDPYQCKKSRGAKQFSIVAAVGLPLSNDRSQASYILNVGCLGPSQRTKALYRSGSECSNISTCKTGVSASEFGLYSIL
jgi:hypothetical protein